jgi:Fe-S oxidoreductase
MMDTLKLCVSCKACRHECPTGVDMAKMKIEVLVARAEKHGLSLRDRLVGYLPRYADLASRFAPIANWRNNSPLLRALFEVCRHQREARPARVPPRRVQGRRRGLRPDRWP